MLLTSSGNQATKVTKMNSESRLLKSTLQRRGGKTTPIRKRTHTVAKPFHMLYCILLMSFSPCRRGGTNSRRGRKRPPHSSYTFCRRWSEDCEQNQKQSKRAPRSKSWKTPCSTWSWHSRMWKKPIDRVGQRIVRGRARVDSWCPVRALRCQRHGSPHRWIHVAPLDWNSGGNNIRWID